MRKCKLEYVRLTVPSCQQCELPFLFYRNVADSEPLLSCLRRDIFRHLTGHSPSYFSDRLPGMLTSRITATSNAVFTVENMFVWNVLPPCIATVSAIALIGTVSLPMAAGLIVVAGAMVIAMFHLAAAGNLLCLQDIGPGSIAYLREALGLPSTAGVRPLGKKPT
jgi:ABC-type multidrug transport system fused ATPase/permease subunit